MKTVSASSIVDKSLRPRQLFWAIVLSVFFVVVYSTTNLLASRRAAVPSVYFPFEKHMPFVPFMIVPYMSIDLFFFFAPFLCADRKQMRVHAMRIIFAISVAASIFTITPLKYGFERPEVHSVFAPIFKLLWSADLPFNLAPSLHLALRTILWPVYVRRTRGWRRVAVKSWFIAIGVSTLLVHQHHLIDVMSGVVLGFLALYVFDERITPSISTQYHGWLATRYFAGAGLMVLLAVATAPLGVLALWCAMSMGLVAGAYAGVGERVFRKFDNGHMATAAKWVLEPYLLASKLSAWFHTRGDAPYVEVVPNFIIGKRLTARAAEKFAEKIQPACVIDLAAEFQARPALRACPKYINIPMLDLVPPTPEQLAQAISAIELSIERGPVFVHCSMGYYRSAIVAAAYLLQAGHTSTVDEAVAWIRTVRANAVFSNNALQLLGILIPYKCSTTQSSRAAS